MVCVSVSKQVVVEVMTESPALGQFVDAMIVFVVTSAVVNVLQVVL